MRIVVTGATGNLGSRIVAALVDDPTIESVVALARRRPQFDPLDTSSERVTWAELDVAQDDLVGAASAPQRRRGAGLPARGHVAGERCPTSPRTRC